MKKEFHIWIYNGDRGQHVLSVTDVLTKREALAKAIANFPALFIEFQSVGVYQQ